MGNLPQGTTTPNQAKRHLLVLNASSRSLHFVS